MAANSLTDTDEDAIEALSRRGFLLVRDILAALKGTRPNTNAYDCINDIEENAERVRDIIDETATLTAISIQMIEPLDESVVDKMIEIILKQNQGILSTARNEVNYITGLCPNNAAVAVYAREVTNLMSEYATASRRIGESIRPLGRAREQGN